ncbi:hypothetical protein GCM10027034_29370 [Ramlibacter solisilvae]
MAAVWWGSNGGWYPYAYPYPSYSYTYVYPAAPAYANVWYYCASVGVYYPYVQVCPEGWVPVAPYAY